LRSRLLAAALLVVVWSAAASARVYLSQDEALAAAFPGAERVEKRTVLLDDEQARRVEELARAKLESRLVTLHTGWKEDGVLGHAYIEVHTVRTLPEGLLVVLSPAGEVRSVRLLAFYEPEEYAPPERWLRQFEGRSLEPELRLGGGIHGIAGATLSAQAVTGAVRRALALFAVLIEDRGPEP
jgi:hypothetical protein